jgi:SAM-dependent methyltransferase
MDPRERFGATVEDYRRFRPAYPEALIDWLVEDAALAQDSSVIDIGCGTGISSRQLAERGLRVIGVDPNAAMLAEARSAGPASIRYLSGDAETLDLGEEVDAVVGGQCFHWLDLDRALPRFAAHLAAGGRVVAFWNLRDLDDPLMADYEALLVERCDDYATVGAEPRARAVLERPLRERREASFALVQVLDRAGFGGRVWSSSYVRHGVRDRAAFEAALDALFARYAVDGIVEFRYRSLAVGFLP